MVASRRYGGAQISQRIIDADLRRSRRSQGFLRSIGPQQVPRPVTDVSSQREPSSEKDGYSDPSDAYRLHAPQCKSTPVTQYA